MKLSERKLICIIWGSIWITLAVSFLMLWADEACAEPDYNLVIPMYTKHTKYVKEVEFQDNNYGLLVERENEKVTTGLGSVQNSFGKTSYIIYTGYTFDNNISLAVYAATGYNNIKITDQISKLERNHDSRNTIISPMISYQYEMIRVSTTYPFGKLSPKSTIGETGADIINIQLVIPIK